jgi:hypothetical protein
MNIEQNWAMTRSAVRCRHCESVVRQRKLDTGGIHEPHATMTPDDPSELSSVRCRETLCKARFFGERGHEPSHYVLRGSGETWQVGSGARRKQR